MASVAIAAAAKAEVEAAYVMALKNPREEEDSRVRIMAACKNPEFAEKAIWKKKMGKDFIEGPSIRLAEEVIRHWKNVLCQQTTIFDDETRRIVKVHVKDLEANIGFSKEITIEKTVERKSSAGRIVLSERLNSYNERVFIVVATEDEIMVKEAALVSKIIRTNGLRLIPAHVVEQALEICRAAIAGKIKEDPNAALRKLYDCFAEKGVKPSDIQDYLGHSPDQITPAEIADLRIIYTSLKDGQATWQEIIETKREQKKEPEKGNLNSFKPGDPASHTGPAETIKKSEEKKPEPTEKKKENLI